MAFDRKGAKGGKRGEGKGRGKGGDNADRSEGEKSLPWLWSFVVFGIHLVVYAGTLFPSISGGDATELVFNACQLSVPHPPGYPLFTMIEWVFIKALGAMGKNPAYCANLAAAFLGALAVFFLFLTVAEITDGDLASAVVASVIFGSSRLVWMYSIQAEVFSLNNLFACALFFLTARYARPGDKAGRKGLAYFGSFLCGLALTNQHTIVFYVVTCVCFVYWQGFKTLFTPRCSLILAAAFLAGLSPYAYLFLAPGFGEPGSWGDTSTVGGFLTHLLRREYGTFRLFSGNDAQDNNLLLGLARYWEAATSEDYGLAAFLAGVGVVLGSFCHKRSRAGIACVFFAFCFYTVTFHYLANLPLSSELHLGVHARFWMQSHVGLHILAGAGISCVFKAAGSFAGSKRVLDQATLLPLSMLLVAILFGSKYKTMDESENYIIYNAFRDILGTFPQGSKVIVKGDLFTNSIRYLQRCENFRRDVELVDQAMLTYEWFVRVQSKNFPSFTWPGTHYHPFQETSFSMHELLRANHRGKEDPVFMLGGWNPQDPTVPGQYQLVPWGFADLVAPRHDPYERWGGSIWSWYEECAALRPGAVDLPSHFEGDRWEAVVHSDATDIPAKEAVNFLNYALANGDDLRALEKAEEMMSDHIGAGLGIKPHHYRNLGITRNRLMTHPEHNNAEMYDKTREAFRTYLDLADAAEEAVHEREAIEQVLQYEPRPL
ncbi:DUF2723 domain-containing protein [Chloropicon primus]|uniref:DUF2723 domain-containing protein n=1 Tax=Chloropicon primus TaxID=1764295 RepID=A0A5B8MKD8_9CHLO|nr:hypothetical protein A3770_03p23500 [Chloropicon primus]UPQ99042.1 DUF2723 domain-containing protein [Chloropicon primus]|eukprot:QDZ19832.1 hypothetical protein A3770_03p23500 [Chloropicon primus]